MSARSDRVEYLALRGVLAVLRSLPFGIALALGARLGDLAFGVVRIRRKVAIENLRAAFPERTEREIRTIARNCYRSFGRTVVEFARLPRMRPQELLERIEIRNREHLDGVLASGRGAILLTGHFGNWEWMGALFPAMGLPAWVIAAEQHNRLVDALINDARRKVGLGVLFHDRDVRGMIAALREGGLLAVAGDQDAGRDGVFVRFLGREASTAVGPVRLARRFGVPILMGFAVRVPGGRFRLELAPPIHVPTDREESEVLLPYTRIWSGYLEEYVRRYPDHWFWMHRRWMTRPESVRRPMEASA